MITMIIADDEFIVRDGLRNYIPWEEFGIKVIGEASDGQEALDLCESLKPDILFTDIRMPVMDGLEVSFKLKEQNMDIRIIILSGIQDFNYAKTALSLNAEGYILKPVKLNELRQVIQKVVASINMERNKEQKLIKLKNQLKENMIIAREKFLYNLITGFYAKEDEINEKLRYFEIPPEIKEEHLVCVLQIDNYNEITSGLQEWDRQLLSFSVTNILEEILSADPSGICFCSHENEFIMIFFKSAIINEDHLRICENLMSCLEKFLQIPVSIGIGREVSQVMHINASYTNAVRALQYKFYTGSNSMLNIKDIESISDFDEDKKNMEYMDFLEPISRLTGCLKLGNSESVQQIITKIFDEFMGDKKYPIDYIQNISAELIYTLSRTVFELGEKLDALVENHNDIMEKMYKIKSIYELRDYLISIFLVAANFFSKKYTQKNDKIVKKIKDIIKQKYMEDISVAGISENIYLTPNYISLIFKQETGETITEYITRTRMEAAKELLSTTDFKILEIAEMVGYDNPHYFSTVFKKYSGTHPAKYRSFTNNE